MPHLFQTGSSLGPRLGLWSSPLLPHSSPGSAHPAHGPKYQLYVDDSQSSISSPDLSCRCQLEHPSPLSHLHLDVRETLRWSVPKMELLVFSQTHLPQPFPYPILPSVQVNALKSSLTLLSHPQGIQKYRSLGLQNMPQIHLLSPLPNASMLA